MITNPRSSLTESKSSRKESSYSVEMLLIKSVGAANRQSPTIPRKFVALYHRNTKLWILPVKRDKVTKMPPIKSVGAANRQSPTIPRKFVTLYHRKTKLRMRSDERDKATPPQRQCDQGREKFPLLHFVCFVSHNSQHQPYWRRG